MGIHIAFALLPKILLVCESIISHTSMICDAIMFNTSTRIGIHIAFALLPRTLLVCKSTTLNTTMICDAIMFTPVNTDGDAYCVCFVAKDSSAILN